MSAGASSDDKSSSFDNLVYGLREKYRRYGGGWLGFAQECQNIVNDNFDEVYTECDASKVDVDTALNRVMYKRLKELYVFVSPSSLGGIPATWSDFDWCYILEDGCTG